MASDYRYKPLYNKPLVEECRAQVYQCTRVKKSGFEIKKAFACASRQEETSKLYACKRATRDPAARERLKAEYEIMKYLKTCTFKHVNLVRLKGFDKKSRLLVMEYCGGGSLSDLIRLRGALSESVACHVMHSLMNAIAECHSVNVMHGDVNPDNILFTSEHPAQLKLCGFEFSKHLESGETCAMDDGTERFMAPECFSCKKGMEADIWAAGITLYCMLSGDDTGYTVRGVRGGVEEDGWEMFPHRRWHSVSSEAKDVIRQLLTFDPQKRLSVQGFYHHPWFQSHKNSKEACDEVTAFAIQKGKSREEEFAKEKFAKSKRGIVHKIRDGINYSITSIKKEYLYS